MKILIVAGSRTVIDKELIYSHIDKISDITEIVSGMAKGPDRIGLAYALQNDISCRRMPADWNRYPKAAGHIRNAEMADVATHLLAFWDGISSGTLHMISVARKKGLRVRVILI
jgi:YspA, cpYpsA-related SLOG family